jgi:hypothetical protein
MRAVRGRDVWFNPHHARESRVCRVCVATEGDTIVPARSDAVFRPCSFSQEWAQSTRNTLGRFQVRHARKMSFGLARLGSKTKKDFVPEPYPTANFVPRLLLYPPDWSRGGEATRTTLEGLAGRRWQGAGAGGHKAKAKTRGGDAGGGKATAWHIFHGPRPLRLRPRPLPSRW